MNNGAGQKTGASLLGVIGVSGELLLGVFKILTIII